MKVSVIGAGTMGAGIAQIASTNGHEVCLYDSFDGAIENAEKKLIKILNRLVEKERITKEENKNILDRINFSKEIKEVEGSGLIIEAIIENLDIKQKIFSEIEKIVDDKCILASNTSSLSIASIASACNKAERVIGVHFFNPAPLMPLVEIIPAVQTSKTTLNNTKSIIDSWGKVTVIAKDTPGFIVNRVARPFYGEALRIYEEGIADFALIAINFPGFMDGRGFSVARLLRERYGFTGELRASGGVIRDQLCYLQRCGFSSFDLDADINIEAAVESLNDFSEGYQISVDLPTPLFRRRA